MNKEDFNGIRAKGKNELLKYQTGKKLTHKQAVLAKCYDCCSGYADGKKDCKITDCPLYPTMPYRDKEN